MQNSTYVSACSCQYMIHALHLISSWRHGQHAKLLLVRLYEQLHEQELPIAALAFWIAETGGNHCWPVFQQKKTNPTSKLPSETRPPITSTRRLALGLAGWGMREQAEYPDLLWPPRLQNIPEHACRVRSGAFPLRVLRGRKCIIERSDCGLLLSMR